MKREVFGNDGSLMFQAKLLMNLQHLHFPLNAINLSLKKRYQVLCVIQNTHTHFTVYLSCILAQNPNESKGIMQIR